MLTPTQLRSLQLVARYAQALHRWPSTQDIANKRHVSKNSQAPIMRKLQKQGLLQRLPLGPESGYQLTTQAYQLLKRTTPITIATVKPPKPVQINHGKRANWWRKRKLQQRNALINTLDSNSNHTYQLQPPNHPHSWTDTFVPLRRD